MSKLEKTLSIIVSVLVVLLLIKGKMAMVDKYIDIEIWGLVLKSVMKSPTIIQGKIATVIVYRSVYSFHIFITINIVHVT